MNARVAHAEMVVYVWTEQMRSFVNVWLVTLEPSVNQNWTNATRHPASMVEPVKIL